MCRLLALGTILPNIDESLRVMANGFVAHFADGDDRPSQATELACRLTEKKDLNTLFI